MYLSDLALTAVRSYGQIVVAFRPGVTVFVGENGQGKTNLVEAIGYLATLSSHRVSSDSALIAHGAQAGVIQARVFRGNKPTTVEVELYAGRANRARINRGNVRPPEILGIVRCIVFAPEDLSLVKGDPGDRRNFLDSILVQLRPRLAGVKQEYEKVAKQRAALLKTAGGARRRGGSVDLASLDVWDMQLARLGASLISARVNLVARMRPHVENYYRIVSGGRGLARIDYLMKYISNAPYVHEAFSQYEVEEARDRIEKYEKELMDVDLTEIRLMSTMAEKREEEIIRGVNLVGPHRDDLSLSLGDFPAKGYASHGESWSYALALKLAAWEVLKEDESGDFSDDDEPILILDDVFAELDSMRRERLVELIKDAQQVFITAAVGSELPEGLQAHVFRVKSGSVTSCDTDISNEVLPDMSGVLSDEEVKKNV